MRVLSWLLALAIALQGSLAAAHCLRALAEAPATSPLLLEICTHEGVLVRPTTLPGEAPADPEEDLPAAWPCLACQGFAAALPAPSGPFLAVPWCPRAAPAALPEAAARPQAARAPPYRPTGPPSLS